MYNDEPQQLQLKQKFPEADPTFVLVSLKKKQAKIGVAGGTFGDGKNLTLVLGQTLTLVNTATGVRYELKLVYTGSAPEQIESFTTGEAAVGGPGEARRRRSRDRSRSGGHAVTRRASHRTPAGR